MAAYDDLVPAAAGAYDDLVPESRATESTVAGGPRIHLPSSGESGEALSEAVPALGAIGQATARGGKTLLAAFADLASTLTSEPGVENLRAYAENPERKLPVQEGIDELHGLSSIPTKAAAGIIQALPAIGVSMGLAGAGVPVPLAGALPLSADESGELTPGGALVGAALPGVSAAGERAVAGAIAKLPMKEVALVLSRDPLRLKGKVIQKFGPLELSNDTFRKWLETGGGALAANAFLLATQTPEILDLPPEQRGEAVLDSVAANIGPSLLGFAARRPVSISLERMAPDILGRARDAMRADREPPASPRGAREPIEEGGWIPPGDPVRNPDAPSPYDDLIPRVAPPPHEVPQETPAASPLEIPASPAPPVEPAQPNEEKPHGQEVQTQEGTPVVPPPAPVEEGVGAPSSPAPTIETPPEPSPNPGHFIANYVANTLGGGGVVSRAEVVSKGAELGLDEKDSEEWAELGSTEAARALAQDPEMTDREKFAALVSLYERMPRNVTRSLETKVNQQYSTPPPLAFLGSVLADFKGGTGFADVTAGHGMTMIGARPGSYLALNEIDRGRALRLLRFARGAGETAHVSRGDATDPEWIRGQLQAVDRLGLNPPFGTILGAEGASRRLPILNASTRAKDTILLDAQIPLNALTLAKPGSKAFVIIGAKTGTPFAEMGSDENRAKAYRRPEFLDLFTRFKVVDWFTIGGDLYRKMGAGWPVDMIIVHGSGMTPLAGSGGPVRPWVKPPRVIESWEELAKLVPEHGHDNIKPGGQGAGATGGGTGGVPAGGGKPPAQAQGDAEVHPPRRESPPDEDRGGTGSGSAVAPPGGTRQPEKPPEVLPGDSGAGIGKGPAEAPREMAGGGTPAKPSGPTGVGAGRTSPAGTDDGRRVVPQPPTEGLPASLLVPYQGVSKGTSLNLVAPRNIAGQMLAAQRALEVETGQTADEFVAQRLNRDVATLKKQLAGAQIDAVALAIRNIERGSGLITADETGVGKGRMVAAILEYARMRGLVPVFVTAKKNLYTDMVSRDLPAVGNSDFKPFITDNQYFLEDGRGRETKMNRKASVGADLMGSVVRTGNLPEGAHAVFTTYSQLGSDAPSGRAKESPKDKFRRKAKREGKPDGPRWAMLRAVAPRAIFILDEAHLAAGKDSEVNLKFSEILPLARGTYYSSATFAKRPDNLGLYALGTSINRAGLDHEALADALTEGGVPLQQALTSMLAESGELVRRQQDWTGVEMEFKSTSADPNREVEAADTYTAFVRDLIPLAKQINRAGAGLADTENQVAPEDVSVRLEPLNVGSRLFNLSNQYLLALRSRAIVHQAVAELRAGRKPFIALYNTMEGPILDLKARKLPLSFAGMLRREMAKMLTVTIRDPRAEGGKRHVELKPEDLEDGGAYYRELEKQIQATDFSDFPISPIDYIRKGIQDAGYSVAEMTARDSEVTDTGEEIVISKREKAERSKILKAYNHGDVDVLVVNGSGSTGLSAHTAPEFKDQRQRVMIVGQPAPDINEFMQMIGRVMRSGQTSKPVYRILSTALAAERRFATMLRGKMTSLNANTTAEGESGMTQTAGFTSDVFNEVGDRVVYRVLEANADLLSLMDLTLREDGPDDDFARFASGRFVLLPNADAHRLWSEIAAEFRAEIEQLDEAGQNPLRAVAEDLKARTVDRSDLVAGTGSTPFDGPAILEHTVVQPPKRPATHAEALDEARKGMIGTRERVRSWLDRSVAAEEERVTVAKARGGTDAQIDKIRTNFATTRERVAMAYRQLEGTYGVDAIGDGTPAFHGVAVELRLSDASPSDFASSSRQFLVLRTNTYARKATLPLSKVFAKQDILLPVDESEADQVFDTNAESSSERYVVTGNLLRGWEAAKQATSGRDMARPRVAIFTRDNGDLATGILMPPSWRPAATESGTTPIANVSDLVAALGAGKIIRSAGNLVRILPGPIASVVATMAGRRVWGDPTYRGFFRTSPTQKAGRLDGILEGSQENLGRFLEFLHSKGVQNLTASDVPSADSEASRGGAFVVGYTRGPGGLPTTFPVRFGGMALVRPIELPELVRMARQLSGTSPSVRKLRGGADGRFYGDGTIALDPGIFRDPDLAARILAHEIGHLVDYLPDSAMKRGNLLGHLAALKKWLKATWGGLSAKDLRQELLDVTRWWRPYDPAVDPPTYVKYRESPEELYADALSVLFNAPAELERRAPKFYAAFWTHIDRRPEVRDALFAVQDLLARGRSKVIAERERSVEDAFAEGEARWKQAVADREAKSKSWDGWWERMWQELYWQFYPLERRAQQVERRGVALRMDQDPRAFLDDLGYRDVTVMRWGRMIFERIVQPLEVSGMTLDDLGKLLLYDRIIGGDRSGLANPGGLSPASARLGLLKLNLDLGLDRMAILRAAAQRFHQEVFALAKQAVEVGAYNRQTFRKVIEPNRDTYATFAVLDYVDDWIPAGIKEQVGTLKDVANPFQATVLKSIALIHLIAYQQAKNKTVAFLTQHFPSEIERATGDTPPAMRKDRGVLMRLENGRPAYYYVDPYVADAFEKLPTRQLWWLTRAADGVFRRFVYPFIITYNPGFLLAMSPARDLQRTGRNLPGQFQRLRLLRDYAAAIREVWRRYQGESGPLIREMEANLGLGTPFDQIARANRSDFLADLLRRMRVLPDEQIRGVLRGMVLRPIRGVLDKLEAAGMTLDTLAKVAAYRRLRRGGMSPREAASWVRNYAGLPNINKKGLVAHQIRALIPFWNVFVQGWRADARLMTNPKTRSGWWFKYMTTNGLGRVMAALAASGVLGEALKALYDAIGAYDQTNYLTIPLGTSPGGEFGRKTVYARIPESETDRLLGGIISAGIRSIAGDDAKLRDVIDFGMGQIPPLNPMLTVPAAWGAFASGQNPRDPFTGRDIVPKREWAAGGWNATEPMVTWTLSQSGMLNLFRFDPQAETTTQVIAGAIPGLNRLLKTSDQGLREQQRATMTEQEAQVARAKLGLPSHVQALEMEFWHLARTKPALRTPEQSERYDVLRGWYRTTYLPAWGAIEDAQASGRPEEAKAIASGLGEVSDPYRERSQYRPRAVR